MTKRYAVLFSDGSMNVHPDGKRKTALRHCIIERDENNKFETEEKDRARIVTFDLPDEAIKSYLEQK